ncbi:MAG: hypothetical protein HY897_24630 [Deltaproteobacteria bacterium]|nr:hypothetical protein [Deltaproteobacteria bacterium]
MKATACVGVMSCLAALACGGGVTENGADVPVGRDAGGGGDEGPTDAGTMDAGAEDASEPSDRSDMSDRSNMSDAGGFDASDASDPSDRSDPSDVATPQDSGADAGGGGDEGTTDAGTDTGVQADSGADTGVADTGVPDAGNGCVPVDVPPKVEDSTLPGENPPGKSEARLQGSFHDEYLYDSTNYIKIGVRREWGGSVIFFGLVSGGAGMNGTNTIDANDTGREVQVAFYDPDRAMQNCAWNASCRTVPTSCAQSITFLGWDPVQGGNRCNNGSGVDSVANANGLLSVVTTPLFWNPDWDRQDCNSGGCSDPQKKYRKSDVQVTQRLRFVRTHVVEIDYTISNLADFDHAETAQEMPTLYSANGENGPDLWKLVDSNGTEVPIDQPAGGDGFNYKNLTSPGGWVTMQNTAEDYGVGIYYENRLSSFQGWQLRSLPFNNVRAIFPFAIPPHASVRARAYLIVGGYGTVSAEAAWLDAHLAPFGSLDVPSADATVSGAVEISGWALDNKDVTSVELLVDGKPAGAMTYGSARPDVCKVWPQYRKCPNVGYGGTLDTSSLSACQHLVEAVAEDADGNSRVIDRKRFSVSR